MTRAGFPPGKPGLKSERRFSRPKRKREGTSMDEFATSRRDVLLASLISSLPIAFAESVAASPLNPEQTIIRPPDKLVWKSNPAFPEPSVDMCPLAGDINQPGIYYTLVRWWPGFMSPHLHDGPLLRRRLGNLVVQQRSRFRPRFLRSGAGRKLRAPGRADASLRRGDSRPFRTRHHRDLRHRAGELRAERSLAAGRAARLRRTAGLRRRVPRKTLGD